MKACGFVLRDTELKKLSIYDGSVLTIFYASPLKHGDDKSVFVLYAFYKNNETLGRAF